MDFVCVHLIVLLIILSLIVIFQLSLHYICKLNQSVSTQIINICLLVIYLIIMMPFIVDEAY